jgi:L-rhamnose mutarotase
VDPTQDRKSILQPLEINYRLNERKRREMQRYASVIGMPAANREEYERLHADVWPEVLAKIAEVNIRNYSIYRYGELLFSYFEYVGEDFEADMAKMAADPKTQEWWSVCMPLQRPVDDRAEGEWWAAIPEVFHVD